jgi:glycoprotein endo-alpha-1,2-mannosidase
VRRLAFLLLLLALAPPAGAARAPAPVSVFYYPWYGTPALDGAYEHWQQGGHRPPGDIGSDYYPTRGAYSSTNPRVLDGQIAELAAAGVGEVVSSWWGWGSQTDGRLPALMHAARAHGLAVAVQLEPYDGLNPPYVARSAETVGADLDHLRELGVRRVYVYAPFADVSDAVWAALAAARPELQILAQTANVARAAAAGFDGVYTYDIVRYGAASFDRLCRRAHAAHLVCAPSVGPGFEAGRATGDARVKPRLDGRTYDSMWGAALRAGADRVTITSYNEWHEGTQIEPASAAGSRTSALSPTVPYRYRTYDGAYGLHGRRASRAYLERTAYWIDRYDATLTASTSAEHP